MKVFVTGADGFIGSHLVEALIRHGYDALAFAYIIFSEVEVKLTTDPNKKSIDVGIVLQGICSLEKIECMQV